MRRYKNGRNIIKTKKRKMSEQTVWTEGYGGKREN
jgi:hypothetical protein